MMPTDPARSDLASLLSFAHELADAARPVACSYFRRPLTVENKADASPVTIADRETERVLRELICARYPEHGIYGEEHGQERLDAPYTWVIDPIDGTRSFITGMPVFGTLLALLAGEQPLLGVIEVPALAERWVGAQGQPTRWNGAICTTSTCTRLEDAALFATGFEMFAGDNRTRFDALSERVRLRRFGADCYAYGLLAAGFVDLVVEADLKPYDYLPLVAVVTGAGGCISDWQGRPLNLRSDGRVVAAATPALHECALAQLGRPV